MAYNDKNMVNDYNGHKIPQYYNPVTDKYEPLHGADGVSFVGNHVLSPGGVWIPQTGNDDGSINTRLTGSNVEKTFVRESTEPRPVGNEGDRLFLWDTRQVFLHDGTDWREV